MIIMSKKLVVVDGCKYCPYFEEFKTDDFSKFYKCNKLQICVEANKTYLPNAIEHLFKFCPLPDYIESIKDIKTDEISIPNTK